MSGYFWHFGDCRYCGWPHHLRYDYPSRRRLLRFKEKPPSSFVVCCNCGKLTTLEEVSR